VAFDGLALQATGRINLIGLVHVSDRLTIDRDMTVMETTAVEAPSSTAARLFARDNGAGKTQLCVWFATGDVQVLATEP
jgi:hypothetical protein